MSSSSSQSNGVDTCAPGAGPHRPRAEHRLVRRVLVEVDEDPLAALLLPPRVGDDVGSAARELARDRDRGARAPRSASTAVRAARTRGCRGCRWSSARRGCRARRAAPSARARRRAPRRTRRPGCGSRSMRSSSACSSSAARLGHTWKPRQPRFTAQTMCARSAATSASRRRAVGRAHHRRLEPVGRVLRAPASGRTTSRRRRSGTAASAPAAPGSRP